MAACAPRGEGASDIGYPVAVTSREVSFQTPDGTVDGWFVHPIDSTAPGVIFWPDIAGLREAKKVMATRLAEMGYSVLIMNPYYRDTPAPIWSSFADFAGNGGWDRARAMRAKLDAAAIGRDTVAAVAWLDAQPEVDTGFGIGAQGYCMGGPFAVWSAAAVPGRVKAAASFHGGGLVRDDADSPHRTFASTDATYLIAVAQDDDAEAPEEKTVLAQTAEAAGRRAKIDVYAGDHGWTVPDSPAYAKPAAERAFANLVGIYTITIKE